jgi:hypothetical protein
MGKELNKSIFVVQIDSKSYIVVTIVLLKSCWASFPFCLLKSGGSICMMGIRSRVRDANDLRMELDDIT